MADGDDGDEPLTANDWDSFLSWAAAADDEDALKTHAEWHSKLQQVTTAEGDAECQVEWADGTTLRASRASSASSRPAAVKMEHFEPFEEDWEAQADAFREALSRRWGKWRETHPVREVAPAPGGIRTQPEPEATTAHLPGAVPWSTYWECDDKAGEIRRRECLIVPYANHVGCEGRPAAAKPLAGTFQLAGARLHTYQPPAGAPGVMEVYTNVHRVISLAKEPPWLPKSIARTSTRPPCAGGWTRRAFGPRRATSPNST